MARPPRRFDPAQMPETLPVFPLPGALLLPRGQMPLNIFEPRYLAMVDAALGQNRLIGMVQPALSPSGAVPDAERPDLAEVGCAGRITSFVETDDGRYLITLTGVTRFRVTEELLTDAPFRSARISAAEFESDLTPRAGEEGVDRDKLLATFRDYLEANDMTADWDSVGQAGNEALVNALAMLSPFGPREKQALLEAEDLGTRAELLIAITELSLGEDGEEEGRILQ